MHHDIIVIGASAGGVAPLLELASQLPEALPATVLVVLHTAPGSGSILPELLSARGPLPARYPFHAETIAPSQIYVAPPDNHLLLRAGGVLEVVRGPRENGHRPAVDALFRSAASAYASRVIGVVLSGNQTCGTAGMLSIKARGGLCVVQKPETAEVPEMPRSVLDNVAVDGSVAPGELAALLTELVSSPAPPPSAADSRLDRLEGRAPGAPVTELVCPECHGVLRETQLGSFEHFRCHAGHTFTITSLLRAQDEDLERALWSGVRVLEESAALARRLAGSGPAELQRRFAEKAHTHARQAELIRELLLHGERASVHAAGE